MVLPIAGRRGSGTTSHEQNILGTEGSKRRQQGILEDAPIIWYRPPRRFLNGRRIQGRSGGSMKRTHPTLEPPLCVASQPGSCRARVRYVVCLTITGRWSTYSGAASLRGGRDDRCPGSTA